MKRRWLSILAGAAFAAVAGADVFAAEADEPLRPLPQELHFDARKVALGRQLFVDVRLAKDDSISCASCHDFAHGGADPRPRSFGVGGAKSGANAPSVFNSGLNFRQLWNGSARSLEEFLDKLIKNPKVFDSNWDDVVGKLRQDQALVTAFADIYPDGVTRASIIDATATYTRSLITPSRFDRYLRGDAQAITAEEQQGYVRFKSYGCIACHQGMNVGGNMFQKFGVMGDYFRDRGNVGPPDMGRFAVTQREGDKHVFKVPSLRNVELTAPYFHDASAPTLEAAVEVMFKYQLGRTAPVEDKALIVKFLKTLTGERQPRLAAAASAPRDGRGAAVAALPERARPQ
ncbi:MAG TPA: cytochrome c peroxidase [Casimicrobiaceae bacterium]